MGSQGQRTFSTLHIALDLVSLPPSKDGNALAGAMINVIFAYTGWNNGAYSVSRYLSTEPEIS